MTNAKATHPPTRSPEMERRAKWGSFIGTAIEWYDFYLYGTAAALVFSQVFFTDFDGPDLHK